MNLHTHTNPVNWLSFYNGESWQPVILCSKRAACDWDPVSLERACISSLFKSPASGPVPLNATAPGDPCGLTLWRPHVPSVCFQSRSKGWGHLGREEQCQGKGLVKQVQTLDPRVFLWPVQSCIVSSATEKRPEVLKSSDSYSLSSVRNMETETAVSRAHTCTHTILPTEDAGADLLCSHGRQHPEGTAGISNILSQLDQECSPSPEAQSTFPTPFTPWLRGFYGMGDPLAKQLLSVLGEAETSNNLPDSRGNLINHSFLWVQSLSPEDSPQRRPRQPTPVFLPGEFPWTEAPSGLQSIGLQRVGHDWSNLARVNPSEISPFISKGTYNSKFQPTLSLNTHEEKQPAAKCFTGITHKRRACSRFPLELSPGPGKSPHPWPPGVTQIRS